jgi:hypothetical protein
MSGLTSAATQYTSASTAAGYVYNNQATKQPSRQNFVPSFLCCSINENEDGGILRGFDDILKLLIRRIWLLQFRCQVWDRLQEAQQQAALHRVIHILRERRRGNEEGKRMNDELTPTRTGCRFVSSFFIHTSSFAFGSSPAPDSDGISPLASFGKCRRKKDE